MIPLTILALVLAIPTVYLFGQQQIENALADLGTDDDPIPYEVDNPHLDPNSCRCDDCLSFIEEARDVLRQQAITEADFKMWSIEAGWPS